MNEQAAIDEAKEIFEKFYLAIPATLEDSQDIAKECAIICCNEILDNLVPHTEDYTHQLLVLKKIKLI